MPFVEDQQAEQQQPQGKGFVPDEQPNSGSAVDTAAGAAAGAVGGVLGSVLLRRMFPGLTMGGSRAFLQRLDSTVRKEITSGGIKELGGDYRAFINQLGKDDPSDLPRFSDYLAHKGINAPETMKLIEQAKAAGPNLPSQIAADEMQRAEGAKDRTLDAFGLATGKDPSGSLTVRVTPNFFKSADPQMVSEAISKLPPDQQAAAAAGIRQYLANMPYGQFANRFLSGKPQYANDVKLLQAVIPDQDARTAFINDLKSEQMKQAGARGYTPPGSVPGGRSAVDAVMAAHDAVTGGFHPLSLLWHGLTHQYDPGELTMKAGNRLLFEAPQATPVPGVGPEYSIPALDAYNTPSMRSRAIDAGLGAAGAAYGSGSFDEDQDAQ